MRARRSRKSPVVAPAPVARVLRLTPKFLKLMSHDAEANARCRSETRLARGANALPARSFRLLPKRAPIGLDTWILEESGQALGCGGMHARDGRYVKRVLVRSWSSLAILLTLSTSHGHAARAASGVGADCLLPISTTELPPVFGTCRSASRSCRVASILNSFGMLTFAS